MPLDALLVEWTRRAASVGSIFEAPFFRSIAAFGDWLSSSRAQGRVLRRAYRHRQIVAEGAIALTLSNSSWPKDRSSAVSTPMSECDRCDAGVKSADERHDGGRVVAAPLAPAGRCANSRTTSDAPRSDAGSEVTQSEAVYERVAPVVRRTVRFYAATDPERDDIAQDALISILRSRGSVADPKQLEAWAARVTFNTILSAFRRRKLRRWLPLEAEADEPPVRASDFEGREILTRVQQIFERLPEVERAALSLKLLGNLSQLEIAGICGCSLRTVRRRLKSARQRFTRLARADPALRNRVRAT